MGQRSLAAALHLLFTFGDPALQSRLTFAFFFDHPRDLEIPGRRIKSRAQQLLDAGPPTWSDDQVDYSRYTITGLLDDLAEPRDADEYRATLAALYHLVANHFLRANRYWGATSKTIPRRLAKADDDLARRYSDAFASAFHDDPKPLFVLSDSMLEPGGGRLFEGYAARSDPGLRRNPPSTSEAE